MIRRHFLITISSLLIPAGLFIGGCASKPETTRALEEARAAYAQVQANPNVQANAEVASYEASQALRQAENAQDTKTQEQLAYIAQRKAEKAIAIAEGTAADKQLQQLTKDREKYLLSERQMEINKAKREAEAAQMRSRQMEAELAELQAKQTERGVVLTLGNVLFATDKAVLLPGAMQTMDKLAEFLQKNPDRKVMIEGHTDNVGSDQYNVFLSQRRADAVKKALMDRGIPADRIVTKGYGKTYPVAGNNTAAGRQQNRRVEVVVLNPGTNPETVVRQ